METRDELNPDSHRLKSLSNTTPCLLYGVFAKVAHRIRESPPSPKLLPKMPK